MTKLLRIKTYNALMSLYFFLVFLYVYNSSFFSLLHNESLITCILISVSSLCLLIANIKYINKKISALLLILLLLSFFIIFRNGDIANNTYTPVLYSLFIIFSIYILHSNNKWHTIALRIINFFVLEHIIGTFFCFIFQSFYYEHILPIFPGLTNELLYQFNHDQIAGLTNHYSKNALYLVSGILINISQIINSNKKTANLPLIVFLTLNIIALLLTGKRSQVVICIAISIIILAVHYRKHLLRLIKKIAILVTSGFLLIVMLMNIMPSISNPFIRAYESINDASSMQTRTVLYDLAIEEFLSHPLAGIGWNGYKYEYHLNISQKEREYMIVHNIYLQLLCDTGIIGGIFFFSIFLSLLVISIKDIRKTTDRDTSKILYIFLSYHLFFLLEGILGNSLYDLQTYTPYAITLAMYLYYHYQIKSTPHNQLEASHEI